MASVVVKGENKMNITNQEAAYVNLETALEYFAKAFLFLMNAKQHMTSETLDYAVTTYDEQLLPALRVAFKEADEALEQVEIG